MRTAASAAALPTVGAPNGAAVARRPASSAPGVRRAGPTPPAAAANEPFDLELQELNGVQEMRTMTAGHVPVTTRAATAPGSVRAASASGLKQYAYTRPDGRVVLSKDAMELEMKEMKLWNREAYEARVRQKYLEERVVRSLYTQKLALKHAEMVASQRRRQQQRIAFEMALRTPYVHSKAVVQHHAHLKEAERQYLAPQFSDIAAIERRLVTANLAARGVGPRSHVAKPSTALELTLLEMKRVPPNGSLMHPRNQVTSPLPDKKLLMPYDYDNDSDVNDDDDDDDSGAARLAALRVLVAKLDSICDMKRTADLEAERASRPYPRLPEVVRDYFARLAGPTATPDALRASLAELRQECLAHVAHPKVDLFMQMVGWAMGGGEAWDATRTAACLLFMMFLSAPTDEATKVVQKVVPAGRRSPPASRPRSPLEMGSSQTVSHYGPNQGVDAEVRLTDVEALLKHLHRQRLISSGAIRILRDAASMLVLPPPPPPAPPREFPAVSVDALLLSWMSSWGSWDYREDRQLIAAITAKYQPRATRRPLTPVQ